MTASDVIRPLLKSQYHAALAMLRECIDLCPNEFWLSTAHKNAFWQVAYHTLFFTHLYLQENAAAFRPWQHHQGSVQHPDGIPGPSNPDSTLPLIPEPYTKAQVLEYWLICDRMVDPSVDVLNLESPECGFWWYKVSKLEHQMISIRHIQHHAAQLADRLRSEVDVGIQWVGSR